jgi:hypothetical protein
MAMGGRDRHPAEDGPTLGARALMNAVEELCRSRGLVGFRVLYKKNATGQHVVAIVFPPQPP